VDSSSAIAISAGIDALHTHARPAPMPRAASDDVWCRSSPRRVGVRVEPAPSLLPVAAGPSVCYGDYADPARAKLDRQALLSMRPNRPSVLDTSFMPIPLRLSPAAPEGSVTRRASPWSICGFGMPGAAGAPQRGHHRSAVMVCGPMVCCQRGAEPGSLTVSAPGHPQPPTSLLPAPRPEPAASTVPRARQPPGRGRSADDAPPGARPQNPAAGCAEHSRPTFRAGQVCSPSSDSGTFQVSEGLTTGRDHTGRLQLLPLRDGQHPLLASPAGSRV